MAKKSKHVTLERVLIIFVFFSILIISLSILWYLFNFDKKMYVLYLDLQEEKYTTIVREQSASEALSVLKKSYTWNSLTRHVCHDIAHFIGLASYEKSRNLDAALEEGDSFCWSGYYHGVIENYLLLEGIDVQFALQSICSFDDATESYSLHHSCLHGFGHAIMFLKNNELFQALEICDGLAERWDRESCYSGVFMENANTNFRSKESKYLREQDPTYPCTFVEDKYKRGCYIVQSSYMLITTGYNFEKVFSICENADSDYMNICYNSIGRDAVDEGSGNLKRTRDFCLEGHNYDQHKECIQGAIQSLGAQFGDMTIAKQLCELIEDNLLQKFCYQETIAFGPALS